ncbi:MAG TPA: hypothetical protein VLS93_14220, partial [Anaeromyxobacteraceae bacterium]|nr:hypothetical protein [Anaeromyxobacteraceae bacterium]
ARPGANSAWALAAAAILLFATPLSALPALWGRLPLTPDASLRRVQADVAASPSPLPPPLTTAPARPG